MYDADVTTLAARHGWSDDAVTDILELLARAHADAAAEASTWSPQRAESPNVAPHEAPTLYAPDYELSLDIQRAVGADRYEDLARRRRPLVPLGRPLRPLLVPHDRQPQWPAPTCRGGQLPR